MSVFWIKALQLIICFAILIILHEGGHFFFSKLFGVRVEKFFMFFDYKFHLFSTKDKWFTRLFPKMRDNETEYGIGWIPLGGYVKIAGMIDESMDTEQMKKPAQPDEFRSKPVYQRFFIMVGGVLVNFILALIIYAMILFTWGSDSLPMQNITYGFAYNEMAQELGFRDGDIPVSIDGQPIEGWDGSVYRAISQASEVIVLREGAEVSITMPAEGVNLLDMIEQDPRFLAVRVPARIDSVMPESPAALAGMRTGARILSVDGKPVEWWADFDAVMNRKADILAADCSHADSVRLRTLPLVYLNADSQTPDTVVLQLTEQYMMGVIRQPYQLLYRDSYVHHDYGFLESIPAGIAFGWETLKGYVSDLRYVFTKQGAQSVGSFGTIGDLFPAAWDWQAFWSITAFISIILAVMNILPIPGLDGGHIFFLMVEAITRRPPSEKFMERAQMLGMLLLLALMALALFNDAMKFLF